MARAADGARTNLLWTTLLVPEREETTTDAKIQSDDEGDDDEWDRSQEVVLRTAIGTILEDSVRVEEISLDSVVNGLLDVLADIGLSDEVRVLAADAMTYLAYIREGFRERILRGGATAVVISAMENLGHLFQTAPHLFDRCCALLDVDTQVEDDQHHLMNAPSCLVAEAACRMLSVFCVLEARGCEALLVGEGVSSLALAVMRKSSSDTRQTAIAGMAAVARWCGPRRAHEMAKKPYAVEALVLALKDEQSSHELRCAVADALARLAIRHNVRSQVKELGGEDVLRALARSAQLSGDIDIAAKVSVAAGLVSGRKEDEFGFLVLQNQDELEYLDLDDDSDVNSVDERLRAVVEISTKARLRRPRSRKSHPTNSKNSPVTESSLLAFGAASTSATQMLRQREASDSYPAVAGSLDDEWKARLSRPLRTNSKGKLRPHRILAVRGIPSGMRRLVWPTLLRAGARSVTLGGKFQEFIAKELPQDVEHTIEVDVVRTMPEHRLFWAGGAQIGVESLRQVLRAYAVYNPDIGYCQGMSSIAAILLMHSNSEQEAFFMLVEFMEKFGFIEIFLPGFPGLWFWLEQFRILAQKFTPDVVKKLEDLGVAAELYADKWFITALAYNFPHAILFRLWDIMLIEGNTKILFRSALATLKGSTSIILSMGFEDVLPFLQKEFGEPRHGIMGNVDEFVATAQSFRYRRRKVEIAARRSKSSRPSGSTAPPR
mmetsp:Transcript_14961/g.30402  ORF Transcript_14961/g.30402 Transcript_14961/m.30402 type:complete len:719 (-) Transcript_14961:2494-4650(-)